MYPEHVDSSGIPNCDILKPNSVTLTAVNGTNIKQYGPLQMPVWFKDSPWQPYTFYVCDTNGPAILGCADSKSLGIISVDGRIDAFITAASSRSNVSVHNIDDLQQAYPEYF